MWLLIGWLGLLKNYHRTIGLFKKRIGVVLQLCITLCSFESMDEKELLERALSEIKGLRRQNELMRARLDMFDNVMSALHGQPAHETRGAMSPDIGYDIEKYLKVHGNG